MLFSNRTEIYEPLQTRLNRQFLDSQFYLWAKHCQIFTLSCGNCSRDYYWLLRNISSSNLIGQICFCRPIRFKTRSNGQTFQFWPRLGSFTSLRALGAEKVVIINKIASALTVRVEVSKACHIKLMKKSAYFLENTRTAYFNF